MLGKTGALVYGTITIGALLAAESALSETYLETVGAVLVALLVYWLAHAYSDFTSYRLAHHQRLTARGLGRSLAEEVTILLGAVVPLVVLIAFWITGGALADAVTAAVWSSAAMVVVIEVVAGLRARLSGRDLLAQAALGTLCGVLVLTLRVILH